MAEYMNYGTLQPYGAIGSPTQPQQLVDNTHRTQVYQATHDGQDRVLPYMYRSFISFTYGGRRIEDFDLIATISGDRINHNAYSSFEDTVTSYDNLDGQRYWSTHYKTNQMDFVLSTDGIDQKMLDNFLYWFKAGVHRELILAEHPNRAVMARVATPPVLNLLPFEQDVDITISDETYTTKTTLYKGDIQLSLIMDKPHWYAKENVLGKRIQGTNGEPDKYVDKWDDPFTGVNDMSIFASKDALKILYEDGIPLGSMISNSMLLGNGAYANVEDNVNSLIWSLSETDENYIELGEEDFPGDGVGAQIDEGYEEGYNEQNDPNGDHYYDASGSLGVIAGAIVDISGNGIENLAHDTNAYFFYAGTAPSPTIISFTFTPSLTDGNTCFNLPRNSISDSAKPYNEFVIESLTKQTLKFTTPNVFTSYNTAVAVFEHYVNSNYSWEKVRNELRNQVRHAEVRAWAVRCLNAAQGNSDTIPNDNSAIISTLKERMSYMFKKKNGTLFPVTFIFNSETGEAKGTFTYRKIGDTPNNWQLNNWSDGLAPVTEDVGDMLLSNYIIIQDRNYPSTNGKILGWQNDNDMTRQYSHRIYHDVDNALQNIQILYKNMYL